MDNAFCNSAWTNLKQGSSPGKKKKKKTKLQQTLVPGTLKVKKGGTGQSHEYKLPD